MPTITTVDATWTNLVAMDDAELRRADSAMFLGDGSANGVRGGIVRHGDFSLIASINGSDQVTVQPGVAVIPAATGLGVYRAALSAATPATGIDPRNATNPRIDLIVFRSTGAVDIITGTPGASPSAPALPSNAIELGRITVPAVAGGAAVVSHAFRSYATALGGTIQVESAARLPGSGNQKGQRAVAIDTGAEHIWSGTAWLQTGAWQSFTPNFPDLPISSGSSVARYRIDDTSTVEVRVRGNVTGPATGAFALDLPVPAASFFGTSTTTHLSGMVIALNQGVGTKYGSPVMASATQVQFLGLADGLPWGAATPHTWKNTDIITVHLSYERA